MSEIAFIGLGTIGRGIVRNLLGAGHAVTARNRTQRPLPADLDRAIPTASIADAVRDKPFVWVCVTGPDAQRAVFDDALLRQLGGDVLVTDPTTTDPEVAKRLAQAVAERGSLYLDAPVFGSKTEAWEGRLEGKRRRQGDQLLGSGGCRLPDAEDRGDAAQGRADH